ncbi:unnamed protein product [Penicillium egyptiacum]|uniref:Oligopeptide transporter n=1 Tax=Penicillium egyptiacum TaxID=1303716 RepID=A0A9W4KH81_9EURO|nr:unnamed protein product [Penicillium egyptiacum]
MADSENRPDEDYPSTPTEWEEKSLRRVCDKIPWTIFLVAVAELAERFTYRCITAPMQNYIENAYNDPLRRGALGKSRECGVLILFVTSFPTSIKHGAGLPGLIVALILIGLGFGGIKSNVAPLIADQSNRCRLPGYGMCHWICCGDPRLIFLQVPFHAMTALSEVFAYVAGMEYAYTKSPKSMRSIASSLFLVTCSVGSLLGIALSPVSKDPKVLVEYASLSGAMLVTAIVFLLVFRKYNKTEEKMKMLNSESSEMVQQTRTAEQAEKNVLSTENR